MLLFVLAILIIILILSIFRKVLITIARYKIDKLESDPEMIKLEQQISKTKKDLESIKKKLDRNLEERKKNVADMKKAGIDVDINMTWDETFKAYENWNNEFKGAMKSRTNFKKYFSKYYKK